MLLRAAFWITLVSLLMPREPDLGFGRPGAPTLPSQLRAWTSQTHAPLCRDHQAVCSAGADFLDSFQSVAIRSLAQVKADIEAAQRARSHS